MIERLTETLLLASGTPSFWVAATLIAYLIACRLFAISGHNPLVNPVLISGALIIVLLSASGTSYQTYQGGGKLIHFLLGPATVALAVPLYSHLRLILNSLLPIVIALVVGALTASVSTIFIASYFNLSDGTILTVVPKSVTTPIAMGIAEKIGGIPELTAVMVIMTGIFGAMTATHILKLVRINDPRSTGFSIGLSSHGIGTARAFQISEEAGAFSCIAMSLNGLVTATMIPILIAYL